jgi:glyoxylase-like metal-dependent hydrolase (beta-lactamase superfamily II)/ferredoxin
LKLGTLKIILRGEKMAQITERRNQNIAGNFYVDNSCIDCDTCRWMAPEIFRRIDEQSAVYYQPVNQEQETRALQALLSCPTASIGTKNKPKNIKEIQNNFPLLIAENVYHCGYHSKLSYGAASYFIKRDDGNILIDSPRFIPSLVKKIEEMGGVKLIYLTHRDDVADHKKYHEHFGCDRLLHEDEITADTQEVEIKITGNEPIKLDDNVLIIPVPGHTKGHTILLYKDRFLFTGDHLCWSDYLQQLIGFKDFCWYSWDELKISMAKLTKYEFEWVLPGHGRRFHADKITIKQELNKCLQWMETVN